MYFPEEIWRIIKEYQLNFNPTLKRLDYQYSIEAYLEDFNDTYADEYNSDTDTDTSGYFQVNKTIIQIFSFCKKTYKLDKKINKDLKMCYLPVAILQRPVPQPKTAEQLHYILWRHNQVKTIKMNDLPAILDEFYVNLIKTEIMKNLVNHYTYNLKN